MTDTTPSDELIKRLRAEADNANERWMRAQDCWLFGEAADALERLTPTEEEKRSAELIILESGDNATVVLLRKFVLGETK